MSSDGLLSGSSHYVMRYPECRRQDAGTNTTANENQRPSSRRRDSAARRVPPAVSDSQPRVAGPNVPQSSTNTPLAPATFTTHDDISTRPSTPSFDFRVSSDCDPLSDSDEPTSPRTEEDRYHRSVAAPRYGGDTSDESDVDLERQMDPLRPPTSLDREMRCLRGMRRSEPNLIESSLASESSGDHESGEASSDVATRPAKPKLLTPHAKFFLEKGKDVVSVKFDPPMYVSSSTSRRYQPLTETLNSAAKYILLKLWSPVSGANIDIQSVLVHGFAGPRLFPAQEMA